MNEQAGVRVDYRAADEIQAAIARIGRTEDVKFSPNGRMLAIAGLRTNRILLLGVEVDMGSAPAIVTLHDWVEIESSQLDHPHGLTWLDDSTLIVANRTGDLTLYAVPAEWPVSSRLECDPLHVFGPDMGGVLSSPGSLSPAEIGGGLVELLVCNNYVHNVSRHLLDRRNGYAMVSSETLLHEGLDVPDCVTHSPDGRWLAVSNHTPRYVGLYRNDAGLDHRSRPQAILRGLSFPHGLKFLAGGSALLVSDAGWPYVHLYVSEGDWDGEYRPAVSLRVMDEETFTKGHFCPEDDGPKGIDLTRDEKLMATTCQMQPLAFFDVRGLPLPQAWPVAAPASDDDERGREILLAYLARAETRMHDAVAVARATGEHRLDRMDREFRESRSWRVTAPLRWAMDRLRDTRGAGVSPQGY